ncbi:MAG: hypothetical protein C0417_12225 [Chlorobiaceae bacterium]|nr:hypothetical protein [Chlorobiaceae bacterium]
MRGKICSICWSINYNSDLKKFFIISIAIIIFQSQGTGYVLTSGIVSKNNIDSFTISSWALRLVANIGSLKDSSTQFGVQADATQEYDIAYDIPKPPDPPGNFIQAYFPHSGGNWPDMLGSKYSTDIVGPLKPSWLLEVVTTLPSGNVSLSWDTTEINKLPSGYNLIMRDSSSDSIISLRSVSSYNFFYDRPRLFVIWIDYSQSIINVDAQWNLISIPRLMQNCIKAELFPDAISKAFYYDGRYIAQETLEVGKGYWLKFAEAKSVAVSGIAISSKEISLNEGWNLIGTIDKNIPAPYGYNIPGGFFQYHHGYSLADTLIPGKGYWVKANQAGSIVLNSQLSNSNLFLVDKIRDKFNKLIFKDDVGNTQELYFGKSPDNISPEIFELPPEPPDGIFDVRYASGKYLETIEEDHLKDISITISSGNYPITLICENHQPGVIAEIDICDEIFKSDMSSSIVIPYPVSVIRLNIIDAIITPEDFKLNQNYPNPFNPSTTIDYAIAEKSIVTFSIVDILGKEISKWEKGLLPAGQYRHVIDGDKLQLKSGVYYFVGKTQLLSSGKNQTITKKLIFLK